jgi:hypothetical protein
MHGLGEPRAPPAGGLGRGAPMRTIASLVTIRTTAGPILCAAMLLAAGSAHAPPAGVGHVRVEVEAVRVSQTRDSRVSKLVEDFVLTCHPTGGTLPFAARICRDVDAHPVAMLHPPCERSHCLPDIGLVTWFVSVVTNAGGVTTRVLSDVPGCSWPRGAMRGVYLAAALRQAAQLATWERRLRCDEGVFLGHDPPDVWVCESDAIALAERTRALAGLDAARLFPVKTGSLPCVIPVGGAGHRVLDGTCSVLGSPAELVFTERWVQDAVPESHTWWFDAAGGPPLLLTDYGAIPPQRRR